MTVQAIDSPKTYSPNLVQKLARVMAKIGRVPKHGRNTFHNYDYATESDIADAVRDALSEQGVMLLPSTEKIEWRDAPPTKNGGLERIATVTVRYTLTDGTDKLESVFVGEGQDRGDKAIYKAYTGAHKYFLLKTFSIATGDDADPEREDGAPPRGPPARPPAVPVVNGGSQTDRVKAQIKSTKSTAERNIETAQQTLGEARQVAKRAESPDVFTLPFGKYKGKGITDEEVPDSYLKWLHNSTSETLDDPAKDQYRDKNEALMATIEAELSRRGVDL